MLSKLKEFAKNNIKIKYTKPAHIKHYLMPNKSDKIPLKGYYIGSTWNEASKMSSITINIKSGVLKSSGIIHETKVPDWVKLPYLLISYKYKNTKNPILKKLIKKKKIDPDPRRQRLVEEIKEKFGFTVELADPNSERWKKWEELNKEKPEEITNRKQLPDFHLGGRKKLKSRKKTKKRYKIKNKIKNKIKKRKKNKINKRTKKKRKR